MKRRQGGFSLMELLIVVTVMLIIAAIAVPKFVEVKRQANASATVSNLKSLNNALAAFNSQYPDAGYPSSLTALGPTTTIPSSTQANLVDESLANSTTIPKQGYLLIYNASGSGGGNGNGNGNGGFGNGNGNGNAQSSGVNTAYSINANPVSNYVASRYFYTDNGQTIRYSDGVAAVVTDPPIGE